MSAVIARGHISTDGRGTYAITVSERVTHHKIFYLGESRAGLTVYGSYKVAINRAQERFLRIRRSLGCFLFPADSNEKANLKKSVNSIQL